MIRSCLVGLFGLVFSAGAAQACEGYEIAVTQLTGFSYNAADPVASTLELQIQALDSDIPRRCRSERVEIEIIGGTARDPFLSSGAGQLDVEWLRTDAINRSGSVWRLRRSARVDLIEGETLNIPFYRLEAGQFVRPGDYVHTLRVTIADRVTTLPLIVTVLPTMRFEGDTDGSTQRLDLGDVTQGSSARSDFYFRTNSALAITLVSDNHGALLHEQGKAYGSIAYNARLSGQAVDLTGASGDTVELPYAGTTIQTGSLEVDVPPTPHQYAGQYRDVITLSFIAY